MNLLVDMLVLTGNGCKIFCTDGVSTLVLHNILKVYSAVRTFERSHLCGHLTCNANYLKVIQGDLRGTIYLNDL